MGWSKRRMPWRELEGRLSDRPLDPVPRRELASRPVRRLPRYRVSDPAYAELHCHSHFSFLDGASSPDELVAEGARLGLTALALTDHDNLCGAFHFAQVAKSVGIHPVTGAE